MTKKNLLRRAVAVSALLGILFAGVLQASETDETAVLQANAQFYTALNAMFTGDLKAMKDVWSHADDVTYMGPDGGFQVGWKQVLADWEAQAAKKLGGSVEPQGVHSNIGHDIAITNCTEVGENVSADAGPRKVSIRATNVFHKEDGKWKMIGHHTDLLPFLEK